MSHSLRHVAVQLDYYMSAQFAGIALACRRGIYEKAGLQVNLLPSCPPGDEAAVVCQNFSTDPSKLHVGSMEQNTLLPAAHGPGGYKVSAVAAMFGRSPLCLAALPNAGLQSNLDAFVVCPFCMLGFPTKPKEQHRKVANHLD